MRNPRFWRKRTIEEEKKRLEALKASLVYSKIIEADSYLEDRPVELTNRLLKKLKLPLEPSPKKKVRRLARKIRRMER